MKEAQTFSNNFAKTSVSSSTKINPNLDLTFHKMLSYHLAHTHLSMIHIVTLSTILIFTSCHNVVEKTSRDNPKII